MPIPLWIALAAFVVLLAATGSVAAVRAVRAVRAARRIGTTLAVTLADVSRRAAEAHARAERLRERSGRVGRAREELQSDLDTLAVITEELRTLTAPASAVLAFVPKQ